MAGLRANQMGSGGRKSFLFRKAGRSKETVDIVNAAGNILSIFLAVASVFVGERTLKFFKKTGDSDDKHKSAILSIEKGREAREKEREAREKEREAREKERLEMERYYYQKKRAADGGAPAAAQADGGGALVDL